ncbi:hypothetical protein [Bizionia myxarmorum]|uniref:SGNH/GDSL hydrolase family protein n=1 Tax=Bizionia myxarmorum TaxID=291186 RepID=A0A5D0R5G0_9FLAO|nr:hypothetical protein [Bizionia myxarmorum]TYB76870.1 hypothetical protein ES674_09165 [Bizionia myxarmorum]
MKQFLKYTLLFLLPVLVIILLVEIFYRSVPNNYTYKHELIESQKETVETLIFGDSHTFYGLNPKYFSSKTLNMANVSQTLYFDKLLFEKYISEMKNLKHIIIPLEYTTMSQVDNTQEDIWRKYFYAEQMELDVPLITWYDIRKYSLAFTQKFGVTVRYYKEYKKNKTLVGCDDSGWGNTYISAIDSTEIDELAKIISRKHDDATSDFSVNKKRLNSIIETCIAKDIQVILVNMPVSQPYLKLLNQEEVQGIVDLTQELGFQNENVTAVNLLYDTRFQLNDFHDADHLNSKGAKKCSQILNAILEAN